MNLKSKLHVNSCLLAGTLIFTSCQTSQNNSISDVDLNDQIEGGSLTPLAPAPSTPPDDVSALSGGTYVSCENVEEYNKSAEELYKEVSSCSFRSIYHDYSRPGYHQAEDGQPYTGGQNFVIDWRLTFNTFNPSITSSLNYDKTVLRTDDPLNIFYGVKVAGSCQDPRFKYKVDLHEAYDNITHTGGLLPVPSFFSSKFSAETFKNGSSCFTHKRDSYDRYKEILKGDRLVFKKYKDEVVDGVTVVINQIGSKKWLLKSNQNFSSCRKPHELNYGMLTAFRKGGAHLNSDGSVASTATNQNRVFTTHITYSMSLSLYKPTERFIRYTVDGCQFAKLIE